MLTDRDIACFYQCHRNRTMTEVVLRRFRTVYPSARVHLISDHGDDFSDIALRYGCDYHYASKNIGRTFKADAWRMEEWFRRFLAVCHWSGTTPWILNLEDDVLIRKPLADPQYVMVGNYAPPRYLERSTLAREVFARHPEVENRGYGCAGGAVVERSMAIRVCEHVLCSMDSWMTKDDNGNGTDKWMALGVYDLSYQYAPNPDMREACRRGHQDWRQSDAAIIHQLKDVNDFQ